MILNLILTQECVEACIVVVRGRYALLYNVYRNLIQTNTLICVNHGL
jgi:hypothetical protein